MAAQYLTTREVGDLLGVEMWRVRRLYEAHVLPEPPRLAGYRAIPRSDIPRIIDALRERGWLPEAQEAAQ